MLGAVGVHVQSHVEEGYKVGQEYVNVLHRQMAEHIAVGLQQRRKNAILNHVAETDPVKLYMGKIVIIAQRIAEIVVVMDLVKPYMGKIAIIAQRIAEIVVVTDLAKPYMEKTVSIVS